MSSDEPQPLDTRLLDLHLGVLSAAEQAELRQRIANDPALAAQDEALAGVFQALRALRTTPAPADLVTRTMARVRNAPAAPWKLVPAGSPADSLTPALAASAGRKSASGSSYTHSTNSLTAVLERDTQRVIRLGNLRDVLAIAAVVVLAVGLGVPGMLHLRERGQRTGCSENLAQLGMGLQQYASSFGSSLPFSGFDRQRDTWQLTPDHAAVVVPNHRHVYRLLQLRFIQDPRLFVCPSQQHVPMPTQDIQQRQDFVEDRNLSYAYQNMAGPARPSADSDPELPVLSDDNPLFTNGVPLFDRLLGADPHTQNSRAHSGAGQNVLTLSGHVKWVTTPMAGVNGDNIWLLEGVNTYTGHEGPTSMTDSHLLK